MLSPDADSYAAIQALIRTDGDQRPIVFWFGAGVSSWAGFPMWQELATHMHSTFARSSSEYDKKLASEQIGAADFPSMFELSKKADSKLYYRTLASTFKRVDSNAVYSRMLRSLEKIRPLQILTTNVDETLEQSLTSVISIQTSDMERLPQLVQRGDAFVCKLHGTSSSVQSMVFASSDYERLTSNAAYLFQFAIKTAII